MSNGTARYVEIADELREKICAGELASGTALPREVDLAAEYSVARTTMRRALAVLAEEGYIERRKRRGTVVVGAASARRAHAASRREQRYAPDAMYLQIERMLEGKIKRSELKPGDALPAEEDVARTFGVSQPTVRRAYAHLAERGLIELRPYRGAQVSAPKVDQLYTSVLRSFDEEFGREGRATRTEVMEARTVRASDEVASSLELEYGSRVFKLVRLRFVDDEPNVLVETYVPLDLCPGARNVDFAETSLYSYLDACGTPVVRAHRKLELALADAELSVLLGVPQGDPLYLFHTCARTARGRVGEYSIARYRGRSNAFEFETA